MLVHRLEKLEQDAIKIRRGMKKHERRIAELERLQS